MRSASALATPNPVHSSHSSKTSISFEASNLSVALSEPSRSEKGLSQVELSVYSSGAQPGKRGGGGGGGEKDFERGRGAGKQGSVPLPEESRTLVRLLIELLQNNFQSTRQSFRDYTHSFVGFPVSEVNDCS